MANCQKYKECNMLIYWQIFHLQNNKYKDITPSHTDPTNPESCNTHAATKRRKRQSIGAILRIFLWYGLVDFPIRQLESSAILNHR